MVSSTDRFDRRSDQRASTWTHSSWRVAVVDGRGMSAVSASTPAAMRSISISMAAPGVGESTAEKNECFISSPFLELNSWHLLPTNSSIIHKLTRKSTRVETKLGIINDGVLPRYLYKKSAKWRIFVYFF